MDLGRSHWCLFRATSLFFLLNSCVPIDPITLSDDDENGVYNHLLSQGI